MKRRWKFAYEIAIGLHHMHSRKHPVLHRDIKAANFLLRQDWKIQICDFGCALILDGKQSNSYAGTLNWMAPEVLDDKPYTEKSDVYSYGMALYEIASRQEPWQSYRDPQEQLLLRNYIAEGKRPELPDDAPENFKNLIENCWRQDPEERPTFKEILELINEYLIDEGVEDINEEMLDSGVEDQLESLQEEIEVQKMLCGMARDRAAEAESALEAELNRIHELKRDQIENDMRMEQAESEVESLKETLEAQKQTEKKLAQKVSDLESQVGEADRKYKRLEKRLERYKKREEEESGSTVG
eukprot:TRINITY_DN744_c0_g2_i2.p1 TRINITY_DN744_c0_g2~~TRINITY_DN744_c0_g2_i2.p1  ORF type:complete len:299 (-),score=99.36 TRINITY_DN744_c0_g2_i2:207-1103(-)